MGAFPIICGGEPVPQTRRPRKRGRKGGGTSVASCLPARFLDMNREVHSKVVLNHLDAHQDSNVESPGGVRVSDGIEFSHGDFY